MIDKEQAVYDAVSSALRETSLLQEQSLSMFLPSSLRYISSRRILR